MNTYSLKTKKYLKLNSIKMHDWWKKEIMQNWKTKRYVRIFEQMETYTKLLNEHQACKILSL